MWQPTNNNNQGSIQYGQIIAPQDQTQSPAYPQTVTVSANGSLNCAVLTAQDTDYHDLSPVIEGVQNLLKPVDDSGDLSYTWSCTEGTFATATGPSQTASGESATWTAPSSVTINDTTTLTCTITDNGDPLLPFETGYKIDAPVTQHVTVTYVASGGTSSINPTLAVQNCNQWNPNPAYVGDMISGKVTSQLSPSNLDSDGSGPTFVTYDWETKNVYESDDGGVNIPFTDATDRASYVIVWQPGDSSATFNATFFDPGYYILQVKCTANVCDSSTGGVIASAVATGYVGGDASDIPTSAGGSSADGLASPDDANGAGMPVQGVTIICNNTTIAAPKGKIKTVTVSEGQKVTLEAKLGNSDAPSCTWTIPGTAVANYNPSADDANLTELPKPPTQPQFSFYWTSSGTYTVSVSVPETITNADGTTTTKDVPASGTVTVKAPPACTFLSTQNGTVVLSQPSSNIKDPTYSKDPYDELYTLSGATSPLFTGTYGIIFTAAFPHNDETSWTVNFVQVIDDSTETHKFSTNPVKKGPRDGVYPPGCDWVFPYDKIAQNQPQNGVDTWGTPDAPSITVNNGTSMITLDEDLTMWVIGKPPGSGIWIPLASPIHWGWNILNAGQSTVNTHSWTGSGGQTGGEANPNNMEDGEPIWTKNAYPSGPS